MVQRISWMTLYPPHLWVCLTFLTNHFRILDPYYSVWSFFGLIHSIMRYLNFSDTNAFDVKMFPIAILARWKRYTPHFSFCWEQDKFHRDKAPEMHDFLDYFGMMVICSNRIPFFRFFGEMVMYFLFLTSYNYLI